MGHSIVIRHPRPARRLPGSGHPLLLSALLGAVVGALGFAIVAATVDVVQAALVNGSNAKAAESAAPAYPAPDLPREWREWNIGAEVDHMYGGKPSKRRPWIRPNGRR